VELLPDGSRQNVEILPFACRWAEFAVLNERGVINFANHFCVWTEGAIANRAAPIREPLRADEEGLLASGERVLAFELADNVPLLFGRRAAWTRHSAAGRPGIVLRELNGHGQKM